MIRNNLPLHRKYPPTNTTINTGPSTKAFAA